MKQQKSEDFLKEKVLFVNRCTKVTKGGRKFSFSALVAVGNGKGKIGVGFAKANEISDAIRKGAELAKKWMIEIKREKGSIPHEVRIKKDGVFLFLRPAGEGSGLVAGSKVRALLELAGVTDVVAKVICGTNPVNQTYALLEAFSHFTLKKEYHEQREAS